MIATTRLELLKVKTIRTGYWLLAVSAALTVLFASLEASRAGNQTSGVAPLFTTAGLSTVTTVTGWSMLFAAVFGATISSGEFRYLGAALTYIATPNRNRVLVSKLLAATCTGATFGLLSSVIATSIGITFAKMKGYNIALGAGTLLYHGFGAMLGAALLAALGVAVGSLIRSQLAVVIGIFVWGLVFESVIGGLFTSIRPYLPYTAATTMAGIKLGGAAFGPAHGVAGGSPMPFLAAAALEACVVVVVSALASLTTVKHDVT